jgi:hypothetical protein
MQCGCKYTPETKTSFLWNLRHIARHLGVHHRSVSLWVKAHAEQIQTAPVSSEVEVAELDELFTFIGDKKNQVYIVTKVDRDMRCFICCNVCQ